MQYCTGRNCLVSSIVDVVVLPIQRYNGGDLRSKGLDAYSHNDGRSRLKRQLWL